MPSLPMTAPSGAQRSAHQPVEALLHDLRTSPDGLGDREAAQRLAIVGPNELPRSVERSWIFDILRQLTHPLALLLWMASVLALLSGTPVLCGAILGVIVVNAVVAFLQERQAARAVAALATYLPRQARVRRSDKTRLILATELVPGDIIVITEGDRVCADARLVHGTVEVDMSALTGESAPATRSAGTPDDTIRAADAPDALFSGTACTAGEASAVVFATGAHTELGRIAALSQRKDADSESPLERQVRRSAWLIAAVAIGVGVLFLPLGLLAGLSLRDATVFAVGLLVANVPEGLLPTITLALAVGVRVLARIGALVKRLSAVETLGSTTVICTDKTGTLTQNKMQVVHLWTAGRLFEPTDRSELLLPLSAVMLECNELEITADPMEAALRKAGAALGAVPVPRLASYRFDPRRKRMSVVVRTGEEMKVFVKGAPEQILALCSTYYDGVTAQPMTVPRVQQVSDAVEGLAQHGLRILALAERRTTTVPSTAAEAETQLCLLGLVALLDPPRPEVAAAVAGCHEAGIRVHVITGDNGTTAQEVARQVGIGADRVIVGDVADALTEPELDHLLAQPGEIVFARSTPEGKLRIAEALRHNGEVVAMTGDGVNDAPALHHADIGVAMGISGTDVAREAATMILTDDNFATIVEAVRQGRRAYDNLRKFVLYIFAHAVAEVVPFAVFALSAGQVPLPLTVLQILAIDLGTETLPALALGRERAEPDLMSRPPRPRHERLITGRLLLRAWLVMGSISAVLALTVYFAVLHQAGWHLGATVSNGAPLHSAYLQATTATFATIVACQLGTAFAARTERSSLRAIGLFTNKLLLLGIVAEVAFAGAVIYLPALQRIFGTAALPGWVVLLLLPCPVVVWGADELLRWIQRRRRP